MTIQRQYNLPNCTLILEGLSDTVTASSEVRPLMSILVNAECHFVGHTNPLVGGRDFFESLINAVSHYAQEFLSGIHPVAKKSGMGLVEVHRLEQQIHRLSVHDPDAKHSEATPPQVQLDLTTVQLFDLIEAIDQFFADSQTLPDLSLQLTPLPRRDVRSSQPMVKRAVPVAVGASTLAAAIALFSLLPFPKVRQPDALTPQAAKQATSSPSPTTNPKAGASPSPTASASASPTGAAAISETALTSAPALTDPVKIKDLEAGLKTKIDQNWKTQPTFKEELVYRVGVSANGDILGYKYVNSAALDFVNETPLPDLYYKPVPGSTKNSEPLAQYRVVFTPSGQLQVSPWQETAASPLASPLAVTEITDPEQIKALQPKLYERIDQSWKTKPTFDKDLTFKVRLKADGTIVDYKPMNQPANDYVKEVPLSDLGTLTSDDTSPSAEPLALFKVVFKPDGKLEVSPWRGYQP
ncbi:MAG: DUF4335 domain-containing protein [Scytolyngbya sp. HA4215-MV1]|jgi:hypothetical protein|nr:DUF4335 domain-containing protein [Scytolyngbya sp. HA4215-MV1]